MVMTKKTCHTISCCITVDNLESKIRIRLLALNAISERFALATLVLATPLFVSLTKHMISLVKANVMSNLSPGC